MARFIASCRFVGFISCFLFLSVRAVSAQTCELYPIALSEQTLSNASPGTVLIDVQNGTQPGNFGWLSWAGSPSESTLVKSLTPSGDSATYVNPDHASDHQINVGDWIQSKPGVSNSKKVRDALDTLKSIDISVPVWNQTRGQGANAAYRVSAFARVRIVSYQLPSQNRITARFLGYASCDAVNLPPAVNAGPDQTITLSEMLALNGIVTDDGLPLGGALSSRWNKVSGPGTVTFADAHATVTTATFSAAGTYVLSLTGSDSQLSSTDEMIVTVNRDNQPPVASAQTLATDEDTELPISLTGTDPNSDPLTFVVVTLPNHGTLSGTPPQIVYTPATDFNGNDSFTFKVNDGQLDSSNAVVNITIRPINDLPVADVLTVTNYEDTVFPILLSGSDVEGSALTYTVVNSPTNGTLSGTAPNLFYHPATNYFGMDQFTFKVNDGTNDSTVAPVDIVLLPVDDAPLVNAGPDQLIVLPTNAVSLAGSVTYDFFPGTVDTLQWSKLSGPGTVTFGDISNEITTATFSASGVYELQLLASDSFLEGSDTVVITVNAPPVVSAGPLQTNNLPGSVSLNGTATDDGIPTNAVLNITWSKVSGPGSVIFADPSATNTTVVFGKSGIYTLRLTADDGIASASSEMTVMMNSAPVVDAGSDEIITNLQVALDGTAFDDGFPAGKLVSRWSVVSGPGSVELSPVSVTNAQPTTVATFSQTGVYVLRLTADDFLLQSHDEVAILVNAPPVVAAKSNVVVTVGESVLLEGSASDDGIPSNSLSVQWTLVDGTGVFELSNPTNPVTTARFLEMGTYVLRLSANDSLATSAADVTVRVIPINRAPVVDAGPKQLVMLSESAFLRGAVSDDGLPLNTYLTFFWSKINGPGDVSFSNVHSTNTTATFSAAGDYILRLEASDTALTSTADVKITVRTPAMNQPPVVYAGATKVIGLTNITFLDGVVTDDGLPQGKPVAVIWSLVNGPGVATFENSSITNAKVSFSSVGTYVLRLTANDSEYWASNDVTITVYPFNQPPVVNAGPDQNITIPDPSVLVASGETPSSPNSELSVSLSETAHWDNAIGQPGLDDYVSRNCLSVGDDLFVTGMFQHAGSKDAHGSARWNGVEWFPLYDPRPHLNDNYDSTKTNIGYFVYDCGGFTYCNQILDCVAARGQEAFVGGLGKNLAYSDSYKDMSARWSGTGWESWVFKHAGNHVRVIQATSNMIYIGGYFAFQPTNATDRVFTNLPWSYCVASWDGTNWGTFGSGIVDISDTPLTTNPSLNNYHTYIMSMAVPSNGNVHVAGRFIMATPTGYATNIAKWNGQQWEPLGGGLMRSDTYLYGSGMAFGQNGDLYVGGNFTNAGGVSVRNVARWDGTRWWPLTVGTNNGVNGQIEAVAAHGRDIYVGGSFSEAGGVPAWHVAKWDGQFWRSLGVGTSNGSGNGTYGDVYSLAADDSGLYVAGMFSKAGGKPANNIAKWVFPKQPTKVAQLQGRVTDDGLPVNSVLNATWGKVSGPGDVAFANSTNPVTTASFSQAGTYILRLTANDSEFTTLDEVTINVHGNRPPSVDAGPDRAIGISESTVLQATISDDGLPESANLAYVWSVAGGPGVVTFDNPTGTNTTVHFSQQGTYVLRCSANDSQFTTFDDVTVTVLADNQAPYGQPGNLSRTVAFGTPISFTPSQLRDDGRPLNVTNVLWSQISGPGIVSFSNPTNATTTATFSLPGVYVVRFNVNDSELDSFVDVTVTVTTPANYSPTVYAGPSQSVSNLTVLLQGSASDDGLPVGGNLNVYWTKNSGPGTVTFANSNSPVTYVTFSKPGSYVLTLTANDSQYSQTSSLTVSMPNQAPIANAGPDRTIVWPTMTLLLTGSAMDDSQYYAPTATWQKMSGPGIVSFSSSSSFTNTATFSASGIYVLRLFAYDGGWSAFDDMTVTVSAVSNQPPTVDAAIDVSIVWPSNTIALNGAVADDGQPSATTWAEWTKFRGPGEVTFSQSTFINSQPATTATFSLPGTYILRLMGSDSVLTNGDDVTVSVNLSSDNQPPLVNAGQDQTITVTNTLQLIGTVTDDGNPYGSTLSSSWKKISGPGPVYFAGGRTNFTTNLVTTATFLIPGTYVLRLTGSDSATNTSDDVAVVVLRDDPNQIPVVSCGPDLSLTQYEPHDLNASVSDDGLPFNGFIATAWSKISGPGAVFFGNVNVTNSSVIFYATGTYVLRLIATDGRTTAYDDVTVTVVPPVNDAPFAYAGGNLTVVRPNPAVLEAAVFDDGFPIGYPLRFAWTKTSGPGDVSFSPGSGIVTNDYFNTRALFSAPGEYVLRLTADDSEFTDYDEITVTVLPGTNSAPTVYAGFDRSVYMGSAAVLTTDVSDDGLENGTLQVRWNQVSGPSSAFFSSINGIYRATFTAPGDYVLRLTADDGALSASDDVTLTVYDAPAPTAEIASPSDSSIVTAPTAIVGTASSAILQSYVVEYRLKPAEDSMTATGGEVQGWSVLASNSVSVVGNTLAVFDPTLLLNGIYELRLTVTDLAERMITTEPITLIVDRNLKIGHFTVSFNDLAVPVPGLPIQITRTYDSRAAAAGIQGDFGIGWTMDIRNVRLQKNRSLAANWEEYTTGSPWDLSLAYHLNPGRARVVTITFPDGRVEKFRLDPNPLDRALWLIDYPQWRFTPLGNTRGTLVPSTYDQPDGNFLYFSGSIPGTADLYDLNAYYDWINFDLTDAELSRYPTSFRYTSQEGYKYIIDEIAGLQSVTDPNGNTLVIGTNTITWQNNSAGTNKLSIYFQRDTLGRITNIVDAAGHAMSYAYGTNGNLLTFVDRVGQTNGFVYTNSTFPHHLTGIIDARGVMPVRNEYDAAGRLIGNVDALGGAIAYTHDVADNREYVTNRLGQVTINEYDEHGNVTRSIDPLSGVTLSSYDENGNLLQTIDPLGRTNSYTYDAIDNRLTATDPLGNTTRFTYGAQRRVTSVTDPRGNSITNVFDANGNLLSMRDPLGNVTRFSYDSQGLPLAMTNALGQVMLFGYDAQGRLANETDALGHSTSYQRDSNGNLLVQNTTRTTPFGIQTLAVQFRYDTQGRLTNSIFPDGSSAQTIYNSIGKPAVTIDQQGRVTSIEYDELGRVTRTVYPDGSAESSGYDAEGRRVASTNRVGQVTRFDYDANGRLFRTVMSDGTCVTNYFDLAGQLLASTDARGVSTFYGYDAAGRSVAVTNALGQVSLSFYDESGNVTNAVDALGRSTRFVYDQLNRRVQTIFTDGTTQTTWFDALGRRTHEQDQAGKVTAFGYDALGRLIAVTNALGYVTSYAYDELGQRISQTDANNHTTAFEYDSLGRRVKRTLPGGQVETYAYNVGGLLTNRTDFNGYVTTYQYDLMNRLLAKVPDSRRGEPAITFGYNVLGLRTNMADASGVTSYRYDERNRLVQKTKSWAATSFGLSLNYRYDANGNVTNIVSSNPNGSDVSYEYDALNRLSAVNDAKVGRTAYSYDEIGNLQSFTYPNGVHSSYEYDSLNRLTNLSSTKLLTPLAQYAYTVGASGNRLTAAETLSSSALNSHPSTINRIYAYDDVYRLTSESIAINNQPSSVNYGYDPVGNRLSRGVANLSLRPQGFTFDVNDRLNSDSYDANGNTLFATGFNQTQPDRYDSENRLITRQTPTNTVEIKYDGDGNRVSKKITSGGTTTITYYVVDELNPSGYAQVLEEHTSVNYQPPGIHRVYTYGHSLISQDRLENTAWGTSFYGYDGHNSVRYLTDLNGFITDTYHYDAFGNLIARTGDTPNDYLFTGEQYDGDLGLYYLRARYHNPDTGRFWTQDSFEGFGSDPSSLHKYTYCANNPVNAVDPSGHYSIAEMSVSTGLWSVARGIFGATIGGMTGSLAAGYDSILHGRVSNQEIAGAMRQGFQEGAKAGAFFGIVGSFGSVGQLGVSAVGMIYSGIGFLTAYQSYSSGNIEAGNFEAAMAAVGAVASVPGLARGSVLGARGLTTALENYYGGPKSFLNIQRVPAEIANEGYKYPPFSGDAIEFQTGRDMYFVRLRTSLNAQEGRWLAPLESVIGKTAAQLKQLFALEAEPSSIQIVRVPRGTTMRAGRVAAQPQWDVPNGSNAVQYQLGNNIDPENFSTKTIQIH